MANSVAATALAAAVLSARKRRHVRLETRVGVIVFRVDLPVLVLVSSVYVFVWLRAPDIFWGLPSLFKVCGLLYGIYWRVGAQGRSKAGALAQMETFRRRRGDFVILIEVK